MSSDVRSTSDPGAVSTKQSLLRAIDDIELVALELFDNLANHGKATSKSSAVEETGALIELLVSKDKEIQELLEVAKNQANVQETVDKLQEEVDKQQDDIKKLQTHLKEAESLLSNAVYQAKQKLDHIKKSNKNPVPSEDLIKYAHKISASNSVSCPPGWTPGDPRRPYPSDMEMRMGWLGKMSDPSWNFNISLGQMGGVSSSGSAANMSHGQGHSQIAANNQSMSANNQGQVSHSMSGPPSSQPQNQGPNISMASSSPSMSMGNHGMISSPPGTNMGFPGHSGGHMLGMDPIGSQGGGPGMSGNQGQNMGEHMGMRQGMSPAGQGGPGMWGGPVPPQMPGQGMQSHGMPGPNQGQHSLSSSPVKGQGPHRSPASASGGGTIHYQMPHLPGSGGPDQIMQPSTQMHPHGYPGGQPGMQHPHTRPSGPPGGIPDASVQHIPHHGAQGSSGPMHPGGIHFQGGGPPGGPPHMQHHQSGPGGPSQKEVDDVEVMSTDSSSSSSSDSQ